MSGFECNLRVAAPRERVFDVFSDLRSAADHVEGITAIEILGDGPIGVGTRFRETRVMYGRKATEEMEITAFERPTRYVAETRSHGAHFVSEFRFTEVPENQTEVAVTFTATPLNLLTRILAFLTRMMMKGVKQTVEQDMADLKRIAESGA